MKDFIAAIRSVKFSSKSELSSRFFGRLKFSESNFCETLNGHLSFEDGSDRRETLPKRVSDDSRHLIFRRRKIVDEIFGAKRQHDTKNHSFWRSYEFLSVTSRFSTKNHPRCPEFQVSTFLGEGVQRRISFFSLSFGPKPTFIFSSRTTI